MRQRILTGDLKPGERLPTRTTFQRTLASSSVTVQRALNRLLVDGFLVTRGRLGTFVAERPPHLYQYALVLTGPPAGVEFGSHEAALLAAAEQLSRTGPVWFRVFQGVTDQMDQVPYLHLAECVQMRSLAGMIFVGEPTLLAHTPLLAQDVVPRVKVSALPGISGLPAVQLDTASLLLRGLEYLASRGRQRVALVVLPGQVRWVPGLVEKARQLGLRLNPGWALVQHPASAPWTRDPVRWLMERAASDRPDGLVVADEVFLPGTLAGIDEAGMRLGHDVDVVTQTDFPAPRNLRPRVARIGYDMCEVLRMAVQVAQLHPGPAAGPVTIAARAEA